MKVLGGTGGNRTGFRLPVEQYSNAIRYALSLPGVACAVIGIASVKELRQAAEAVTGFKPLTEDEANKLAQIGLAMSASQPWKIAYGDPLT